MIQGVSDKMNKMVQSIISAQGQIARQNRAAAQSVNPATDLPGKQPKPVNVTDPVVTNAIEKINEDAEKLDARLSLAIDKELNRVLIRFKDPESGEIIRQIPPEAVLDMLKRLNELKGAMFDTEG